MDKKIQKIIKINNIDLRLERDLEKIHGIKVLAFYSYTDDSITMDLNRLPLYSKKFIRTLLHELTHWTGSRLNRPEVTESFSKEEINEELIAEISASFLGVHLKHDLKYITRSFIDYSNTLPMEINKKMVDSAIVAANYLLSCLNEKLSEDTIKLVEQEILTKHCWSRS